jgi:hypothetical protein
MVDGRGGIVVEILGYPVRFDLETTSWAKVRLTLGAERGTQPPARYGGIP